MVLDLSEVIGMKKELQDRFSVALHFHDGCGGQYFTLEKSSDELKAYISSYCAGKNRRAVFSEDGLHFTVEEEKSC